MSAEHPQIFEGVLDAILDGRETRQAQLADMLGKVCIALGVVENTSYDFTGGNEANFDPDNRIAGIPFSNRWTKESQIARLTAAKAFLVPKVGNLLTPAQLRGQLIGGGNRLALVAGP